MVFLKFCSKMERHPLDDTTISFLWRNGSESDLEVMLYSIWIFIKSMTAMAAQDSITICN